MKNGDGENRKWTMRERFQAVLRREQPDRMPFIDRMELWYQSHRHADTLPEKYKEMTLGEIHQAVGIGQQKFITPYAYRLRGVEISCSFEGRNIYQESDPVVEYFPATWAPDYIRRDRAGSSVVEYLTPVGKLQMKYDVAESTLFMGGIEPYLKEHLIKEDADYRTVEYILERAEFTPRFDKFLSDDAALGDNGLAVASLHRTPFQQALLEYLGEIPLFTALYEGLRQLERLIEILDQWLVEILHQLADLQVPYVEFGDNLDGAMTNPNLFRKYCLPYYQNYVDILHKQGKKVGSHTDGNLKPLLGLLAESGLDVCESFSPAPLTECTFEQAWKTWRKGPLIWGGIPSLILQEDTSESEFIDFVRHIMEIVDNRPIIWGVGDMVMGNNLIGRVQHLAQEIEK